MVVTHIPSLSCHYLGPTHLIKSKKMVKTSNDSIRSIETFSKAYHQLIIHPKDMPLLVFSRKTHTDKKREEKGFKNVT